MEDLNIQNIQATPEAPATATQPIKKMGRPPGIGNKLSHGQVELIRRTYAERAINQSSLRSLAREFGVSFQMIKHIVDGKCWKLQIDPEGLAVQE